MGAQLAALVVLSAATVAKFPIWAPIDERAHYAYVQTVAEDGRLPRIHDLVSAQVQAITDGTWPRPSPTDRARLGLAGRNYEAFQPPLYYVAAVPAFAVVGDHRSKVFALRVFDVVLLAAGAALLFALARRELPRAPLAAFAGGLLVLLWPGVLVRGVTVSNLPLEIVLASALLLALWHAERRGSSRWLVAAGALLGACLLTKLTLAYLALPFAVVLVRRWRHAWRPALLAAALPALLLAPWLASNLVRLGTLTANGGAQSQQEPLVNPGGRPLGGNLLGDLGALPDGVLPQEWEKRLDVAWIRALALLLFAGLLAGAIAFAWRRGQTTLHLAAAGAAGALLLATATLFAANWDIFLLRYFYAVLPALGVGVAAAAYARLGARALWTALAVQLVALGVVWVDLAGHHYFTNVGRSLGI